MLSDWFDLQNSQTVFDQSSPSDIKTNGVQLRAIGSSV